MSQVATVIASRKTNGSGALIGYLPVGFPDLQTSVDAAVALADNDFDIVELGIPYSDPVMDGPTIQAATGLALQNGFRLSQTFDAIEAIKARVDIPILVMTYWNPVVQYGVDRFAQRLSEAGGAGLITPDLIPDEASDWLVASDQAGLDRVFLAAPSSTDARLAQVISASRGFVYTVSTMGITGARADVDRAARKLIARLREQGATSACVGVGISSGDQVREVLGYADGAIVGSVLVQALADGGVAALSRVARELSDGKS